MSDEVKRSMLDAQSDDAVEIDSMNYVAVPAHTLLNKTFSQTDFYLKLSDSKMIKIANKDTPIDHERLQRYAQKEVRYFYVLRSDLTTVVKDLVMTASKLSKITTVPVDQKMGLFLSIAETVYAELIRLPLSAESVTRAVTISNELTATMMLKPDLKKAFDTVLDLGEESARHALGTVIMANLLAKQLGWESPKVINALTLGAYLHDIGLKDLPADLVKKKVSEMTREELALYQDHPNLGVSQLRNQVPLPEDALRIIQEHHEIPNGTGFPTQAKGDRIFPPAKVVSLANQLAHDLFEKNAIQSFDLTSVKVKIDTVYTSQYGAELSKAVKKIFI